MHGCLTFLKTVDFDVVMVLGSCAVSGPCGGKTTGQARLSTFFENLGWKVYCVVNCAVAATHSCNGWCVGLKQSADCTAHKIIVLSLMPALRMRCATVLFGNF